jgi:hypothetical protein
MPSLQTTTTDSPREPVVDAPSLLATVTRHGRRSEIAAGQIGLPSTSLGKPFAEATAADLLPLARDDLSDDLAKAQRLCLHLKELNGFGAR